MERDLGNAYRVVFLPELTLQVFPQDGKIQSLIIYLNGSRTIAMILTIPAQKKEKTEMYFLTAILPSLVGGSFICYCRITPSLLVFITAFLKKNKKTKTHQCVCVGNK